jgi:hypothetical protein
VSLQVLTAASMKMRVFWNIAPCSLVGVDRRFRGAYCLIVGVISSDKLYQVTIFARWHKCKYFYRQFPVICATDHTNIVNTGVKGNRQYPHDTDRLHFPSLSLPARDDLTSNLKLTWQQFCCDLVDVLSFTFRILE